MSLTREQDTAAKVLVDRLNRNEKVSVLQGPAGSGKSYLLNYLMTYLGYDTPRVAFAAYTGTAAKILMNQGLNASTIHALIYEPIMRRGKCVGFSKKSREELAHLKLIVVDEFSMLPQNILEDLISFNIPIVFVGDQYQLPPIGEPNVLVKQAHAILTEPMRQALDNPILWLANEIRQGKNMSYGAYGDDDTKILIAPRSDLDQSWIRDDVKIIVGMNKTRHEINMQLAGSASPIAGHKIIFLKNDWKNMITNGTIATINSLKQKTMSKYELNMTTEDGFTFDEYLAEFQNQSNPGNQFFDYAYAITCHKAQGATYDSPGLIFDESYIFKEDRYKWFYTAVSRFKGNHNLAIIR